MFTVRKTTRHGQYHQTVTAEGSTKGGALQAAMRAGDVGYATKFSWSNQYHREALEAFETMGTVSLGWSDYDLLTPVTPTDIATALTGSEQLPIVMEVPLTCREITASLNLAEKTPEVSIIVADPTGPNGQREFIATVREVGADSTYVPGADPRLDAVLAELANLLTKEN